MTTLTTDADVYYQGDTIQLKAHVTDTSTSSEVDPDTITVTVVDPVGTTKVDAQTMTKSATGYYYYDYAIPTDGELGIWTWEVTDTKDANVTMMQHTFEVLPQL